MKIQNLPGSIKTKWAMNYKYEMDKAILNALQAQNIIKGRSKTKG